jgi:hypothetical protein
VRRLRREAVADDDEDEDDEDEDSLRDEAWGGSGSLIRERDQRKGLGCCSPIYLVKMTTLTAKRDSFTDIGTARHHGHRL